MKLSLQLVLAATALLPSLVAAVPSLQPRGRNSPDNTCGGHTGFRCGPANDGPCCSQHGWCGASSAYCGAGCQSAFGTCTGTSPPPQQVETDFTCGPQNGNKTCRAGYCCSVNGWCGTTSDYCSAGKCLASFGVCTGGNTTPPNPPTPVIETDFTCGPGNGNKTCREGYCCSQYGYCGVTEAYCGNGCQSGFGQCGVAPPEEPEVPEEPTPEEPEEPEPEEPEPEEPEPEEPEPEEPEPEEPTPTLPEEPEPTPTEIIPAEPDPEECTDFGVGADCGEDFFCCPGAVCNEFLVCDLPPAGPTET